MKRWIHEGMLKYQDKKMYPLHMPGHKRRIKLLSELYDLDYTEVEGLDDLHHPEDMILHSMKELCKIYGSDASYYLVNGSTSGMLSAVSAACKPGEFIAVARNCHKSAHNSIFLRQLHPVYIYPPIVPEMWINGSTYPPDVDNLLKNNPQVKAVVITSPTYDGIVSDIETIADIVHRHDAVLIVDEAHGAHFSFGETKEGERLFPASALVKGADVVIQSLHKTLPSLTQTALLHIRGDRISVSEVERYLGIYQTSSPSYVFLESMESCVHLMDANGRELLLQFRRSLDRFYEGAKELKNIVLMDKSKPMGESVFDFDRSKLVMRTRPDKLPAQMLYRKLREDYHFECEMVQPQYVLGLTTLADDADVLNKLLAALREIDSQAEDNCAEAMHIPYELKDEAEMVLTPAAASMCDEKRVDFEQAEGMMAAEMPYIYPPGIPVFVPGERIKKAHLDLLREYRDFGLEVRGLEDKTLRSIKVIRPNVE